MRTFKTWHIWESRDQKVNSKQNSQENLFQDYLKQALGAVGLVVCQYGREEKGKILESNGPILEISYDPK